MTEVRVGDVRIAGEEIYVVTCIENDHAHILWRDGFTFKIRIDVVEFDSCIAHYDTFIEAISSKEFKGNDDI